MGKCITLPGAAVPDLPAPLTFEPVLPGLPDLPDFCCTLPPLPVDVEVPFEIPSVTITPQLVVLFRNYRKVVNAWLDARPLSCPKE